MTTNKREPSNNDEPNNNEPLTPNDVPYNAEEPYTGAIAFDRGEVRFSGFRTVILFLFRIFLMLFLVAGAVITVSQVIGIFAGSTDIVLWAASLQDTAATLAGVAGVLSFSLIYTIRGGAKAED